MKYGWRSGEGSGSVVQVMLAPPPPSGPMSDGAPDARCTSSHLLLLKEKKVRRSQAMTLCAVPKEANAGGIDRLESETIVLSLKMPRHAKGTRV